MPLRCTPPLKDSPNIQLPYHLILFCQPKPKLLALAHLPQHSYAQFPRVCQNGFEPLTFRASTERATVAPLAHNLPVSILKFDKYAL